MSKEFRIQAIEVIRENDRGHYTVPTKGLYPFQWNWDSALTALGMSHFDEARAWQEIETLFEHQWDDGMVPHIIFHEEDENYFPGPDVWGVKRDVRTSGITQPPVAGYVVRKLVERAQDKALAEEKARLLLPKIQKWHDWFYHARDPQLEGLVAILHPWETGRDNSIDWDEALMRVPADNVQPYKRRDTDHANPEHRPTQAQYDRYIALVELFRDNAYDSTKLHDLSPFQVVDPGMNAILIRSCADVAVVADKYGMNELGALAKAQYQKGENALENLWSEKWQQYLCYDRMIGASIESPSIAGILPVLASSAHAPALSKRLNKISDNTQFLVPSHDPQGAGFEPLRYWRGPVWLIVNYMIVDGLNSAGETAMAQRIVNDSLALIAQSGFAEYYDPNTAEPCGGGRFTWTAAMVIEFLAQAKK